MEIGIEIPRRVLRYADLAEILGRSVRWLYNTPADKLPPRMSLPDGGVGWHPQDVADWLERQRPTVAPAPESASTSTSRRGKPAKSEEIAAKKHGISVPELRRRHAGGV